MFSCQPWVLFRINTTKIRFTHSATQTLPKVFLVARCQCWLLRNAWRSCYVILLFLFNDCACCLLFPHYQGVEFMNYEMKLGWGKAVPIPPNPVYIPKAMLDLTIPPPQSGLPFNAQSKDKKTRQPPINPLVSEEDPEILKVFALSWFDCKSFFSLNFLFFSCLHVDTSKNTILAFRVYSIKKIIPLRTSVKWVQATCR